MFESSISIKFYTLELTIYLSKLYKIKISGKTENEWLIQFSYSTVNSCIISLALPIIK